MARKNPLQRITKDMRFLPAGIAGSPAFFLYTVPIDPENPGASLFGFMTVYNYPDARAQDYEVDLSAAVPGFGPLLYDAVAKHIGKPLLPSSSRTRAALRLWETFQDRIDPLDDIAFCKKYGGDYDCLLTVRPVPREVLSQWASAGARAAFSAQMDEESGHPLDFTQARLYRDRR